LCSFCCHQTLFLTSKDPPPDYVNHPVLKAGVTVQIGMDKTVKLSEVFLRYVDFCNEQFPNAKPVQVHELEFFHTQLLAGTDTAEVAALMKNDRISVCRERSNERAEEETWCRLQRESDQQYFQQLRHMLSLNDFSLDNDTFADVLLECRGVLYNYARGATYNDVPFVPCHSFLIRRRCPWLAQRIDAARRNTKIKEVQVEEEEEERDFELMQQLKLQPRALEESVAAQIENDDEDVVGLPVRRSVSRMSDVVDEDMASLTASAPPLWSSQHLVVVEGHPPEAMRILLEYCYTNRVEKLGFEAFMHSCKTKPMYKKMQGPVPPFSLRPSRWPNNGTPTISFVGALAAARLAEAASVPRLSLMCEVAAAQLVSSTTVVEALAACEHQRQETGNSFALLRKAAMDVILDSYHLRRESQFTADMVRELSGQSTLLVPSLIAGISEAMEAWEKRQRQTRGGELLSPEPRDWRGTYAEIDQLDALERDRERRKRRRNDSFDDDYEDIPPGFTAMDMVDDPYSAYAGRSHAVLDEDGLLAFWGGEAAARSMSLKRLHEHAAPDEADFLLNRSHPLRRGTTRRFDHR
jgi:hypothetical protein